MQNPAPTLNMAIAASASVLTTNLVPREREFDGVAEAVARVLEGVMGDVLSEDRVDDEGDIVSVIVDADCGDLVSLVCGVDGDGDGDGDSVAIEVENADTDGDVDNKDEEALTTTATTASVLFTPSLCAAWLLLLCASDVATAAAGYSSGNKLLTSAGSS
jgi:hypothetical protein